ncbi:MAG: PPC domain-containing protein [Armatimonadota bacterium]|nr:PPC domain-containing protein [Armatimonadota bacterium]
MKFSRLFLSFALVAAALTSTASTWIEGAGNIGDATSLMPGQNTIGDTGSLKSIQGRFQFDDVDVYKIKITDPQTFSATTVGLAGFLDTQIFIFDSTGRGVTHNDDDPLTNSIQSTVTGQFVTAPGDYYLAITQYNRDPQSAADRFLWNNAPFNAERQPDGPGAAEVWTKWTDEPLLDGPYEIQLTGADFAEVGTTPPPPLENIWTEAFDAGSLLPGQPTVGEGLLVRINGALSNANDVDIYAIRIDFPEQFHASTIELVDFDTQLFLFDSQGKGVTFNDDDPAITGSWSHITGRFILVPGTYYLAITRRDQDPRSATGDIWLDEPSTTERMPDGAGAPDPLSVWSQTGGGRVSTYSISLTGVRFSIEGFTMVPVSDYELVRGTPVSGGMFEFAESDDVYTVIAPGITFSVGQDPILAEFLATLPLGNPTALEIVCESRGSSSGLRQILEVFDNVAQNWVIIDTNQTPSGGDPDLALAIDILGIPNVIGPSNKVRARIRVIANAPIFAYPWRYSLDQLAWRIRSQ